MYQFKSEKYNEVISKYKMKSIAERIGITPTYLSQILNNKKECKKTVAYCITKAINNSSEINDYFIQKN